MSEDENKQVDDALEKPAVAPDKPEKPVAQGEPDKSPEPDGIRDPEAWAKAQVEKFQRLLQKTEERAKALEAQVSQMQESQADAIRNSLSELKAEVEAEKQAAEAAKVEAQRVKALVAAGLDAGLAELITATDEEGIAGQVEKLASLRPAQSSGRIGNAAGQREKHKPVYYRGVPSSEDTFGDGGVSPLG